MGRRSSFGKELDGLPMVEGFGGQKKHEEKKIADAADSLLSLVHTRCLSAAVSLGNNSDTESQKDTTDNDPRQTNSNSG
eukprot:8266663-Ditylum_brightwellii.AAC.1